MKLSNFLNYCFYTYCLVSLTEVCFFSTQVHAQIVPDRSLGSESSVVMPDVIKGIDSDRIDGGAIRGSNLFQSFQEFNVGEGRGAYFSNPEGIANIFSRVTGGNISQIMGTLGVLGNANLYFLNPNGILFGPNAQLDIKGSFLATTADSFQFPNSYAFSATNPDAPPLLTVNIPIGLNFRANPTTTIVNQGNLSTGQDLTLTAGNLDLQGQLQAGKNLTLEAQDTVKIRDSVTNPFIAAAWGDLTIQGNKTVDIFALNNAQSGLFSLGNMTLRSAEQVGGDAHFWSGGNFRIELLDGSLGKLYSPHDPVIRTAGDVTIGAYEGASLHIIAGGKVEIPDYVWIYQADPDYGLQEIITLADGSIVNIDGKNQPTLDIRAGVDPSAIGIPGIEESGFDFFSGLEFSNPASSADINMGTIIFKDFNFNSITGHVLLTNQYYPNPTLIGDIQVQSTLASLDLGAIETGGLNGGGNITISSRGNIILTGELNSYSHPSSGDAGDGGEIILSAMGSIETQSLNSYSWADYGNAGNGGNITLTAGDSITLNGNLDSYSYSFLGDASNGGDIILSAAGSIEGQFLDSFSLSYGNAGNGGNITLTAGNNIKLNNDLSSYSSAFYSNAKKAGNIILNAGGNIEAQSFESSSFSNLGDAANWGEITLIANGDITTKSFNSYLYSVYSDYNNFGQGSTISFESKNGSIALNNSTIWSNGSDITLKALNNISFANGSIIDTTIASSGNGGNININTGSLFLNNASRFIANTSLSGNGNAGNIIIQATGAISISDGSMISSTVTQGNIGNAGSLEINASDFIDIVNNSGIFYTIEQGAAGEGGNIEITTNQLNLSQKGGILISNSGIGNSVSLFINAIKGLDVSSSSIISSANKNSQIPSNIDIKTDQLIVQNQGFIINKTDGNGIGGNIIMDAKKSISITNDSGVNSSVSENATGNGGYLTINTNQLNIEQRGEVSTNTFGLGNAGNITINSTDSVSIIGGLMLSLSDQRATGNSGNLTVKTGKLSLQDGSVTISTFGSGNAGEIIIRATDSVTLAGNSVLFSQADEGATGNAGNLTIETSQLKLEDGAYISTVAFGNSQAGNININATQAIDIIGNNASSAITSQTLNSKSAGDINITTEQLKIQNRGNISSQTNGSGNAGNITIQASDSIFINGTGNATTAITTNTYETGKGGDLNITTGDLTIQNGAQVTAGTFGNGDSGKLSVTADSIHLTTATALSTQTQGKGNSNNLIIQTRTLLVENGAVISASTTGEGQGGNLTVNSSDSVELRGNNSSLQAITEGSGNAGNVKVTTKQFTVTDGAKASVETRALGSPGDITITTDALTIGENAQLSATITPTSTNTAGGGSIALNANTLDISGQLGIFAETQGQAPAGSLTINPNDNPNLNIRFTDNGFISARTTASGQGGNIDISAPSLIDVRGQGKITAETSGSGNAGSIQFTSQQLNLADGVGVSATTTGTGNAGNITMKADTVTITGETAQGNPSYVETEVGSTGVGNGGGITIETGTLLLEKGGFISASTQGQGNAGQISIYARDNVTLAGESSQGDTSGVLSEIGSTGVGNSGGITIETGTLSVEKGGFISTNIEGEGDAGLISIRARDSVTLTGKSSQGDPSALISEVGGIGNSRGITLETSTLLLTQGSHVSTSTFGDGNAGNIEIAATTQIDSSGTFFETDLNRNIGGILAFTTTAGRAGNITIATPLFNLHEGAGVEAFTQGTGSAGRITITSPQAINVGESSRISVETSAAGRPGDIVITTDTLNLGTNAQLSATTTATSTNPEGGGSININTSDLNIQGKLGIFAETQGQAPAGNLKINPDNNNPDLSIHFTDDGFISALTSASGQGGNIDLSAPNLINISGQGKITTETSGTGNAGLIKINSQQLNLSDGLEISASTSSSGTGGSITVNSPQSVSLQNSKLLTQANSTGNAGDINLSTTQLNLNENSAISASSQISTGGNIILENLNNLQVKEGSNISASTVDGNAGNLQINANQKPVNSIELNKGSLAVKATGTGNSGNLTVNAKTVNLDNNSEISASTNSGEGGNIDLNNSNLEKLQLNNSNISASTKTGKAGSIDINANQTVDLTNNANITVEASNGGTAGNLKITTDLLSVKEGSQLTVSSLKGQAGNIDIQAKDVLLDRGSITAETGKSGVASGANINLNVTNFLTLRMQNESLISATANGFADGGNITINTPFLIAFPFSGANGNDIIAKAFFGDGGKIQIDAIAIFGIEESKALVGNSSNNIDASSEFGSTGVVQINRAIDPNKGLVSLPTGVVNPNDLIAQNPCKRGKKSQLTLTGRSELPPGLTEDFNSTETQINWVEPVPMSNNSSNPEKIESNAEIKPRPEPAQGWIFNEKGQVTLVTQANANQRSPLPDKGCPVGGVQP